MPVELINDRILWDRFIDESPYGSIFHKWDFLKIVEKYTGYKLLTYGIYRGNELVCVFPLYYRVYMGLKLVFSPPPQSCLPYLGFVMGPQYDALRQKRRESYLEDMVAGIDSEISTLSPNYVSLSTVPGWQDIRPFKWNGYSLDVSYDYLISIHNIDDIWDGFDSTCRKNIRNSSKNPLVLKQVADAGTFYRIMGERLSVKGQATIYQSSDPGYLEEILSAYPDNVKMYFLYDRNDIAGLQVTCEYRNKLVLWLGSANGHYNEYLIWELIKDVSSRGFKEFEIPDADTRRLTPFKAKFNPSLESGYLMHKKDAVGRLAEWSFIKLVRGWV